MNRFSGHAARGASEIPARVRYFLRDWRLNNNQLAREPEEVIKELRPRTMREMYVAVQELLDELTERNFSCSENDFVVYANPKPGQEYQWQLATFLADSVVLHRPMWEPSFGGLPYRLRDLCGSAAPELPPRSAPVSTLDSVPTDGPSPPSTEIERILEETDFEAVNTLLG
jgi:hypothetical protein